MPPGQPDSEGVSQSRIIAAYRCSGLSWIFGKLAYAYSESNCPTMWLSSFAQNG